MGSEPGRTNKPSTGENENVGNRGERIGGSCMKKVKKGLLIFTIFLILLPLPAYAKTRIKARWVERGGKYYAYNVKTGALIRGRRIGRYYAKRDGSRAINEFRRGSYYNGQGKRTKFQGGFIKAGGKLYYFRNQKKVKGFRKIGSYYYFFDQEGAARTGVVRVKGRWRIFRKNGRLFRPKKNRFVSMFGKRYYVRKKGIVNTGFFKARSETFYQTAENGIQTGYALIGGLSYVFDQDGSLNEALTKRSRAQSHPVNKGKYADLLFFTRYESGAAAYAQAGGDRGRAYGKYQFDYRYSLIPFLRYCYKKNPQICAEFKFFRLLNPGNPGDKRLISGNKEPIKEAGLSADDEKKQNWDLAAAWKAVYNKNPAAFSAMQDEFALNNYYMPAERALAARGIHMTTRTYVERGAVFSYSIQEGQMAAVNAVVNAGLTDDVSSRDFLTRLYDYRWKDKAGWASNPIFLFRYQREKAEALSILTEIGG